MENSHSPKRVESRAQRPLKVLLWLDSDVFAGTERHVLELAQGLKGEGVSTCTACLHPGIVAEKILGSGGAVVPMKRGMVASVLKVSRLLRRGAVDVIHAHNGRVAFMGALSCWLSGRGTLVVTQHFLAPARLSRKGFRAYLSKRVHRWIARRVNHWIAISSPVKSAMLLRGDCREEEVSLVFNGMDFRGVGASVQRRCFFKCEVPRIVCVARLSREKNHEVLLAALRILKAEGERFHVSLVGDGARRFFLRDLARRYALEPEVEFVGFQSNPEKWIAQSDFLVLPSGDEPFGLVLLEAMSLGKPVVAARSGGPLEIVEDQVSGLLFESGDARDLAAKIFVLLRSPKVRRLMGEAGQERLSRMFSRGVMSRRTASAYTSALSKNIKKP